MGTYETIASEVVCTGIYGTSLSPPLARRLRQAPRGGFILMGRNVEAPRQVQDLLRELATTVGHSDPPPLLGVDQEGGRVARLKHPVLPLPSARALGALDDPELTEKAYQALGGQLRTLGFSVDFAPVLDIDGGPADSIIGDRAFAGTAESVDRHGQAAVRGLIQAGLCPCGKHFPGHGTTTVDSHLQLPTVESSGDTLRQQDLVPFVGAFRAGLPLLMPAHVVFQDLDARRPATWSPAVLQDLLRRELCFDGVVITDDLTMGAVEQCGGAREGALEALMAGADMLLICHDEDLQSHVIEALAAGARRQPSVAQRLPEAAQRLRALRQRFRPEPGVVEHLANDASRDILAILDKRLE